MLQLVCLIGRPGGNKESSGGGEWSGRSGAEAQGSGSTHGWRQALPFRDDVEAYGSRILRVALRASPPLEFLACYAPQAGATAAEKGAFLSSLAGIVRRTPRGALPVVAGDFNAFWARIPSRRTRRSDMGLPKKSKTTGKGFVDLLCEEGLVVEGIHAARPPQHRVTFRAPATRGGPPWTPGRYAELDHVGSLREDGRTQSPRSGPTRRPDSPRTISHSSSAPGLGWRAAGRGRSSAGGITGKMLTTRRRANLMTQLPGRRRAAGRVTTQSG